MPKYILSTKTKTNYEELNYNKIEQSSNPYLLQSIDTYTTKYKSLDNLKLDLVEKEILNPKYLKNDIRIIYHFKKEIKCVKRQLIFEKNKELLQYDILIAHIITNLTSHDLSYITKYLTKLVSHYQGTYNKVFIQQLLLFTAKLNTNYEPAATELNNILLSLEKFLYIETHSDNTLSYKSFHDLITYIIFLEQSFEIPKPKVLKKELDGQLCMF